MICQTISAQDTYPLRSQVLRNNLPYTQCMFPGDHNIDTKHWAVVKNNQIIGVVSSFNMPTPYFSVAHQYQIRGMAIHPNHQKNGVGNYLLAHAESQIKQAGGKLIWCNARETAIDFYSKQGYQTIGTLFHIPEVGNHYVMYKLL